MISVAVVGFGIVCYCVGYARAWWLCQAEINDANRRADEFAAALVPYVGTSSRFVPPGRLAVETVEEKG